MVWNQGSLRIGNRRLPKPDVRQLMRKREHLSGPAISPIYKNQWGETVGKRKPAKLLRVKWSVVIVQHDAAAHNHDSSFIRLPDEKSQSLSPGWNSATFFDIKAQRVAHNCCSRHDAALQARRSHKRERRNSFGSCEVAIPLLALLANVYHVEQVRTGTGDGFVSDRSEIRNGNLFNRRLGEKQKTDGRMSGSGEILDLFERWPVEYPDSKAPACASDP